MIYVQLGGYVGSKAQSFPNGQLERTHRSNSSVRYPLFLFGGVSSTELNKSSSWRVSTPVRNIKTRHLLFPSCVLAHRFSPPCDAWKGLKESTVLCCSQHSVLTACCYTASCITRSPRPDNRSRTTQCQSVGSVLFFFFFSFFNIYFVGCGLLLR